VVVTGKKIDQKVYYRHSGRPGGMKMETFRNLQHRLPERIVEKAIKGMIPHTRLGRQQYTKLKVYKGAEHPHQAQQPKSYALNTTGENS
jgi:large subunit ribosomal protein L13